MSLNERLSSLSESDIETLDQTLSDISQTLTLTMLSDDFNLPTSFESLSDLKSVLTIIPKGFLTLCFLNKRLDGPLTQDIDTLVDILILSLFQQCAVFYHKSSTRRTNSSTP